MADPADSFVLVLPAWETVPMGPHPPNTADRPQGTCGLAPVPRPTWRMPTVWPTHHAPPPPPRDPQVPPTLSTVVPAWYTKLCPRAVRPNPMDSVLCNQVGYIGPRERTSRQDGRANQETSHHRAVRTWDRPQSYHTRSWAVKYLDQCLCSIAVDPGA